MPPIEVVLSEVFASLTFAAHAYLQPSEGAEPDLEAAGAALDLAGAAFERMQGRLQPDERSVCARSLTALRLTYVEKRDR